MSTVWKWVIGVLGVVIVLALIAGAVYMWRTNSFHMGTRVYAGAPFDRPGLQDAPGNGRAYRDFERYHMHDGYGGMPMMGGGYGYAPYAYSPLGGGMLLFGGLFHLLIPLGVLALVAYIFYQMGKRAGMTASAAAAEDSTPRRRTTRS